MISAIAVFLVCLGEPGVRGRSEAPLFHQLFTWLATLSRIVLPIKWKSQPPRTERGGGGKGRTFRGASSSTFFSDDYSRDPASCSLQLCFQLCRVGLDDVFGKCCSGPFLGHVDQPVDMVELRLHRNSREWDFWITFRKLNLYLSWVRKIKWANIHKIETHKALSWCVCIRLQLFLSLSSKTWKLHRCYCHKWSRHFLVLSIFLNSENNVIMTIKNVLDHEKDWSCQNPIIFLKI